MKLFRRRVKADADGFIDTGVAATAVVAGHLTVVKVGGQEVALTRCEEALLAFDNRCPHAAARLSGGTLNRWKVCCPDHGYCWDIRSGRIVWPDDEVVRLARYVVKTEGDVIKVKLG